MINFKYVQYRNFLSCGNDPIRVNLDSFKSTLVVGSNGSGKSTMLDALSFALFGKPHRNINKPQLLNSINQKNLQVEVAFDIGSTSYKVIRCIKPNVFEIWQNGTLLNQESHSRDYQKVLELNILKLNHKSFHQVVVLGSSSFVPFMQLPSGSRRDVIEDLLDIGIFTKMNGLVREHNVALRGRIDTIEGNIETLKERISLQKEHIEELMGIDAQQIQEHEDDIRDLSDNIKDLNVENQKHQEKYDACNETAAKELADVTRLSKEIEVERVELKHKMKDIVKQAQIYEGRSECPTCEQSIEESFKRVRMDALGLSAKDIQSQSEVNMKQAADIVQQMKLSVDMCNDLAKSRTVITDNSKAILGYQNQISKLQGKIQNNDGADVSKTQKTLQEDLSKKDFLLEQRSSESEDRLYNDVIIEMLKDTGIKTKVIRQYLPVMNRLINSHLNVLDFFISFELDESFNETIRSRHRDNFAYASFSEGEKQRIDLALLFAWRQIAKMKNSVNTNLLILDEIFDSSLDTDGVDNLLKILRNLSDDTRVFIISHKRDVLEGRFDRRLEFSKQNNFTKMIVN